jgi:hypothetical protein
MFALVERAMEVERDRSIKIRFYPEWMQKSRCKLVGKNAQSGHPKKAARDPSTPTGA